jgi:hypothetical protein
MIQNTVPRANRSEGLVSRLRRHRALWDGPRPVTRNSPKEVPPLLEIDTFLRRPQERSHTTVPRGEPRNAVRPAAACNTQKRETSDHARAPKMFAFMVLPGELTAGTGNHNVKQQGPLGPESESTLLPGERNAAPHQYRPLVPQLIGVAGISPVATGR